VIASGALQVEPKAPLACIELTEIGAVSQAAAGNGIFAEMAVTL
jgi:hypothetical protein